MNEIESIKNLVKELLETDEKCRNSDKFLIFRVIKSYIDFTSNFLF